MSPQVFTGNEFHKAEINKFEKCPTDEATSKINDPRYKLLGKGEGPLLTEWEILDGTKFGPGIPGSMHQEQEEFSSVAEMLYYLPAYSQYYVSNQEKTMREKNFGFW